MKEHWKGLGKPLDYLWIVVGSLLFAVGLSVFIKPAQIPLGGVAGLALLINYLWGWPIGIMSLALNLPLYFLGVRVLGREFFVKTLVATVSASIFIDTVGPLFPTYVGDTILAVLYGSIIMGFGFGLIFRVGGTSGGSDVIAKYLYRKKDVALGVTNLAVNGVIIVISAIVYRSFESAMYAIASTYITGLVIDKMILGMDVQREAMIITSRPQEVSAAILTNLRHGVTALQGKGMYTGEDKTLLLCVARRHETSRLKSLVLEADPCAFVLLSEVGEVFGQGFKAYEK